ncbi:hypothetical protein [Streptomyces flaveolus]|uniref:hypothetical protein n=1 Tax=Streptomyces flaveolus TaxID=67297 RepID=UPI0037012896
MHILRTTVAAGLMAVSAMAAFSPAAVSAGAMPDVAPAVLCGTDSTTGLAVSAAQGTDCATALQVAADSTRSTGSERAAVSSGGTTWLCQEQQGDPDPYQECVNTIDHRQTVTLTS